MRTGLDESASLVETISPGTEWVEIGNQRKHVMSYLEDFLFPAARAHSPVRTLSGGERARLTLARMFAQPTNILVLDEPTNDLDIETLELLEGLLQDYTGTVLLVSHDRSFLNNVVTQVIAAEGNGHWQEYVGGYDEWLAQRPEPQAQTTSSTSTSTSSPAPKTTGKKESAKINEDKNARSQRSSRLASWEEKELEALPEKIAEIETQQSELAKALADPDVYKDGPDKANEINQKLTALDDELTQLFERWETLENKG